MENHRNRILTIIKSNIIKKLSTRGKVSLKNQKMLLDKELSRNSSLFLDSGIKKEVAIEEREFILGILDELGWSIDLARERLIRLDATISGDVEIPEKHRYTISREKMMEYPETYSRAELLLKEEVEEIKRSDYESKKYDILYYRLMEIESAKGATWGKQEIDFVVEKRNMGYSFKAIARVLKRPERVVQLKYHSNK